MSAPISRLSCAWMGRGLAASTSPINKAFTAKAFDISTLELGRNSQPEDQFFGIHVSNHARVMIFAGGIPIKINGQIVGARRRQRRQRRAGGRGCGRRLVIGS